MYGRSRCGQLAQPARREVDRAAECALTRRKVGFTTGGNVSATPTVFGEAVFFPHLAGNLYAVNKPTGQLIWSHQISDYDGV